ncbi:MAG: hypothetical protein QM785_01695 [Pyrinomonadaceae bacterium]
MVDEAKAFCPGCGHAFVEEQKRSQTSNFDTMDSTVQLGQTMYNQMLSDMGLNISKAPDPVEKRVEILAPVAAVPTSGTGVMPSAPRSSATKKWIIFGVLIAIFFLTLAVIAAAGIFIYWSRFR